MRLIARVTLTLLVFVLAACGSTPKNAPVKLDQAGVLKAHPGLLGLPVPPELQKSEEAPRRPGAEPESQNSVQPIGGTAVKAAELSNRLFFDYRDAAVREEYAEALATHARRLTENPNLRLRLEGNADERGGEAYNRQLGLQRAEAVKKLLTSRGASARQIKAISHGKANPLVSGQDEASWAMNRRVDLIYEERR